MKHLTFKTVFLLALGSGKRRSELRAWQNRNIIHQSDWSKVSLYPSPSFLSKNQLAKEGPDSVAPVVIYQPWPQLWIDPSSLTGPSVRSELCAIIWTGPRTSRQYSPGNRLLTTDHGLKGVHDQQGHTQAWRKLCYFVYEFT